MQTEKNNGNLEKIAAHLLKIYSGTVVDHGLRPRNMGELPGADGFARFTGDCGDTVEMWLLVQDDTISRISFRTDGCLATMACGSMVTQLAGGKSPGAARGIRPQDVLTALEGLPEGNRHCAALAVDALRAALRDFAVMKREPWKKAYRRS